MRDGFTILKRPVITEKAMDLTADGVYTFEVAMDSNKIEIRNAVETAFNVKVAKVNTLIVNGKKKNGYSRQGRGRRVTGMTAPWKKAYVTLQEDYKIDIYEGA